MPTPARQLCALLHDGDVLTDAGRRVPSYDADQRHRPLIERATTCGDATAVLVSPQLQVHEDPMVLLSVFSSRGERVAGTWTPLDDLAEDAEVVEALRSVVAVVDGSAAPPPRRPDWFRRAWYDEVEAWVDARLGERDRRRTGPVDPIGVWPISAVVRVPCEPGPPVWLKASCRHFHAEPALTRLVAEMDPEHAPELVALDEDRAWLLIEEMAGAATEDDDAPLPGLGLAAARIAARLHVRSLDHLAAIEATGVPVRGLPETLRSFDQILSEGIELDQLTPDQLSAARGIRDDVASLFDDLASHGIPDTLVHGDLHTGNVAHLGDAVVLYDWSDAAVSHPFLDLVLLTHELPVEERQVAREAYADAWRTSYPDLDAAAILALAEHANTVFQAVTFERIQRASEDVSRWEMNGVVARMLRELPGRMAGLEP